MSILNVCIEQREKEQAELKTFLVYSVVASAALHLILAFGIDFFWPKGSSSAEKPIEFIVVDAPKTEIKQPEEKVQPKLPTPKPRVTPKTVLTPKRLVPPKPDLVTPPPTIVTPKVVEKPPEVVKPIEPPPDPIAPQPEPLVNTPLQQPTISSQPIPPPKVTDRSRQTLRETTTQTPRQEIPIPPAPISQPLESRSQSNRSFRNNVIASNPATTNNPEPTEATPQMPGSVETNQKPPERSTPTINNQPLPASANTNRKFRDYFSSNSLPTPTESNPADDTTPVTPGLPGGVTANQQPVSKPSVNSQPLQASAGTRNRGFRDNFSSSNNFLTGSNPSDDGIASTPQLLGEVASNRKAPSRPAVNSQPLQASAGGNRGFRANFSDSGSFATGTSPTDDGIASTPQLPGGVASNGKAPSRPGVNSQPLQASAAGGNRGFRANFSSSNNFLTGSSPTDDGITSTPQLPGGVASNGKAPSRPGVNSQPLQASADTGNRGFRDNFSSSASLATGSNPSDDGITSTPQLPGGVASNGKAPSRPGVNSQPLQASAGGNRGFRANFSDSESFATGTSPTDDGITSTPQLPGGVASNGKAPSRPGVNSQPLQASAGGNRGFRANFSDSSSSAIGSESNSDFSPSTPTTSTGVAANRNVPPRPNNQASSGSRNGRRGTSGGLRCLSGCEPEFPASLANANVEGRPVVQFMVETNGRTSEAELIESSGNSELDRVAVAAVANMKFAPPQSGRASVQLAVNFAIDGSDFQRQARRRRQENERLRRERERQSSQ